MKLNFSFKKNISGFKPGVHWNIILITTFILFVGAIVYSVYLYTYAQKQINLVSTGEVASVPTNLTTLSSPEILEEYFKVYKDRGLRYSELILTLMSSNKPVAATSTATTSVATSTNQ